MKSECNVKKKQKAFFFLKMSRSSGIISTKYTNNKSPVHSLISAIIPPPSTKIKSVQYVKLQHDDNADICKIYSQRSDGAVTLMTAVR